VCLVVGQHLLAIDQGTTGSTVLVMGTDGRTLGRHTTEFAQHFPRPGWVEHEPGEIWESVCSALREALKQAGAGPGEIAAVGITNQRETTLLWERATGQPIHRAIVWQDRRTSERCAELKQAGSEDAVRRTTGLVLDPYFSGTKLEWLLDHVDGARGRAERGELCFGTVDSYLIWQLAGGARAAQHVTDVTNASRTLLMNLRGLRWDDDMCRLLRVPGSVLPRIVPSAGILTHTKDIPGIADGVPISGVAGDQHAALFGQACFEAGDAKCTYGTGAFLLVNTGSHVLESHFGLLSTPAWQIGDVVTYALEGSVFIAGAAVQWLRDGLGIIDSAAEVEGLARSVSSSDGVVFVPALAGLGAPYWDAEARGLITGLTRGSNRGHLARATLEAIACQVADVVRSMSQDLGTRIARMRVDGGAAANDLLLEIQSDIADLLVERPSELESTARGAAMLAGVGAGLFRSGAEAAKMMHIEKSFTPQMSEPERQTALARWADAVRRARGASA
jgi:glycerol kinase